jgi:fido (protein-threonine AMPylation protein)
VGRTRWDAFNAVTEHLDWAGTFRETEFSREENRFESLVTGSAARVRERAMELLLN